MFGTFLAYLMVAWLTALAVMVVTWGVGRKIQNAGIVDPVWAAIIAFLALLYAIYADGNDTRRMLCAVMGLLWGGRLSLYIWTRKIMGGKPEDPRYQTLRMKWGSEHQQKMFFFYMLQGTVAAAFSVPFLLASLNAKSSLGWPELAGFVLWALAFTGEALSDYQLDRFKSNPANKGKTCRAGLWNYSRHPNYFFEWLIWCSLFVFALGSPWGWTAVIFPVLMFHFLRNVTGIPLAEEQALKSRGDDYRDYQRTTSVFFPWFPRR